MNCARLELSIRFLMSPETASPVHPYCESEQNPSTVQLARARHKKKTETTVTFDTTPQPFMPGETQMSVELVHFIVHGNLLPYANYANFNIIYCESVPHDM
jgi:hypothetical protein